MKKILTMISAGLLLVAASCNKSQDILPANDKTTMSQQRPDGSVQTVQHVTVYYNTQLFNARMMRASLTAGVAPNLVYVFKAQAGTSLNFLPVVNKLASRNFDKGVVWQQILVSFTADANRPTQPRSEAEIQKMISAGLATAEKTEVYFAMAITYGLDASTK
jgi:hypothetical protein